MNKVMPHIVARQSPSYGQQLVLIGRYVSGDEVCLDLLNPLEYERIINRKLLVSIIMIEYIKF